MASPTEGTKAWGLIHKCGPGTAWLPLHQGSLPTAILTYVNTRTSCLGRKISFWNILLQTPFCLWLITHAHTHTELVSQDQDQPLFS